VLGCVQKLGSSSLPAILVIVSFTKACPHESGDEDPFFASYVNPAFAGVTRVMEVYGVDAFQ